VAEEGAARGLNVLQQATLERAERAQAAQRTTDVALRTLGMRKAYGEWWVQRSANPANFNTLAKDSNEALTKVGEMALKGIDDPLSQAAIAQEVAEFSVTQGLEAQKTQIVQQIAWSRGALEDQLFQRRQEMAGQIPEERNRLMGQTMNMLQGAAAAGYISPLDAEKKARAFVDGTMEDELNLRVYHDPDSVLEDLYAGRYNAMTVESRQRLTINAEKRSEALARQNVAQQTHDEAKNLRDHKATQELNYGEYMGQINKGEYFDLETPRRNGEIDSKQYRTLYDTQRAYLQAGGPGDPTNAKRMELQAYRGNLSVGDVLGALDGPSAISGKERDGLLQILQNGAAATTTRDYKEGAKTIEKALGVIPGDMRHGEEGRTNVIAGLALREFYQRAVADENFDAAGTAVDIIARYETKGEQPKPRYPSLLELRDAYRRGDITDREFNNEAELFKLNGATPGGPAK
jgi:hypothetical protein